MSRPTVRTTAADRAHVHIRSAILSGELAVGVMLSENDLATEMAMSRTPVRAALARLQEEGLVAIYPQRGAMVRGLDARELEEAAEIRRALETAGVAGAGDVARAALLDRLQDNIVAQERALARGDFAAFVPLALQFHRGFVEVGGNALMLATYDRIQDRQQLAINRSAGRIVGDPAQVVSAHRDLLGAAGSGDWVAFSEMLADHQARSHDFGTAG